MGLNIMIILWFVFLLLLGIRIIYTHAMEEIAGRAIYKYCGYLIDNNQYSMSADYFGEMGIEYFKYLFSFWIFGAAIKSEYKEILKPFME
jgi:hypothetical protein